MLGLYSVYFPHLDGYSHVFLHGLAGVTLVSLGVLQGIETELELHFENSNAKGGPANVAHCTDRSLWSIWLCRLVIDFQRTAWYRKCTYYFLLNAITDIFAADFYDSLPHVTYACTCTYTCAYKI